MTAFLKIASSFLAWLFPAPPSLEQRLAQIAERRRELIRTYNDLRRKHRPRQHVLAEIEWLTRKELEMEAGR